MTGQAYRGIQIHSHTRGRFYWWRGEDDAIVADTICEARRQIDALLGPIRVQPRVASGTGAAL